MTGEELLKQMGNPYAEKYCIIRQQPSWPDLENPLHVALLFSDFDTELCMNGMLGFLENSSGAFLDQTIDALKVIGARQNAVVLGLIREAMHRHGVSSQVLRSNIEGSSEFQIASFSQLHPGRDAFAAEVIQLASALYLYDEEQESPYALLEAYLESRADEWLVQLR